MKLEIKHLAAYLPYELKLKEGKLSSISHRWRTLKYVDSENDDYNTSFERVTPLLKPLSQFEYDHIVQIKEHLGLGHWCDHYDQYFDAWFDDDESVQKLVLQCPYEIMQFFLECHFDVFGLIDAGLARSCHRVSPNVFGLGEGGDFHHKC